MTPGARASLAAAAAVVVALGVVIGLWAFPLGRARPDSGTGLAAAIDSGARPDSGTGLAAAVDSRARPDSARGPWSHPDAHTIRLWSEAAGVPYAFSFAVAWEETRNNPSPVSRSVKGAIGRFQVMPRTAASRCPGLDTRAYHGNLACFLRMARSDADGRCAGDWRCVARVHNGAGREAEAFADSVISKVRQLVNREMYR